ncbi:MAG: hypothetical protein SVT56_03755 [Chloroflexota bacterium]|nr:hypothetical protein [Chloroflexota bacterium]
MTYTIEQLMPNNFSKNETPSKQGTDELESEEDVSERKIKSIKIEYFPPTGSIKITHNIGASPLDQHQIEHILFELAEMAGYSLTRVKPELLPCPACGGEAMWVDSYVGCESEDCSLCGPDNDPDGAKWNALPRNP